MGRWGVQNQKSPHLLYFANCLASSTFSAILVRMILRLCVHALGVALSISVATARTQKPHPMTYSATVSAPTSASFGFFGSSVSTGGHGRQILVGAPNASQSGAAYSVSLSGGQWGDPQQIPASPSVGDAFGSSVALNGWSAVVGAAGVASGSGSAYLYDQVSGNWELAATLTSSGSSSVTVIGLGSSLAWSGDGAVIALGAPSSSVSGHAHAGAGVVFMAPPGGGAFVVAGVLSLGAAAAGDGAFASIATSFGGTLIAGGAPNASAGAGAASVFAMTTADVRDPPDVSWTEAVLVPSSGATESGSAFGAAVAVSGDSSTIAVGAPSASAPGAVYIFSSSQEHKQAHALRRASVRPPTADPPDWDCTAVLHAPSPAAGDGFGQSLALSFDGTSLAVGAVPLSGPGAVYTFASGGAAASSAPSSPSSSWQLVGPAWTSPQPQQGAENFGHALSCAFNLCAVGTLNAPGQAIAT